MRLKLPAGEKLDLEKLEPEQCYSIESFFHPLKPGKYTIQAKFTYKEGDPKILETNILVEQKLEVALNVGSVMLAYTLMRLSLNVSLE